MPYGTGKPNNFQPLGTLYLDLSSGTWYIQMSPQQPANWQAFSTFVNQQSNINMLIHKVTLDRDAILALTDPADKIVLPKAPAGFINLVSSITEYGNTAGFTNVGGDGGLKYYDSSQTINGRQLYNDDPTNTATSVLLTANGVLGASPVQFNSGGSAQGPFTEIAVENDLLLGCNTPYTGGGVNDTLDIYIAYRQIVIA